jgi:hypothetical protein
MFNLNAIGVSAHADGVEVKLSVTLFSRTNENRRAFIAGSKPARPPASDLLVR